MLTVLPAQFLFADEIVKKWEDFGVPGAQEDVSNVNKVLVGQGEVFSFSLVMYY